MKIKKMLKIIVLSVLLLLVVLYLVFYFATKPKTNSNIQKILAESPIPYVLHEKQFEGNTFRVLEPKEFDPNKKNLVFVHGAIGSLLDFKKYLFDADLHAKYNMISYDRIGYGITKTGEPLNSIKKEAEMLSFITENLNKENTILAGYSFGGPIVLANKEKYHKIIVLAGAIASEHELVPGLIAFYNSSITRFLVPPVWKAASIEKLGHAADLQNFENDWTSTPSELIVVQGDKDTIVPYANALFLQEKFEGKAFTLHTLPKAGHALIWSEFEPIKKLFLDAFND